MLKGGQRKRLRYSHSRVAAGRDAVAAEGFDAVGVIEVSWQERTVPEVRDPHWLGWLLRVGGCLGGGERSSVQARSFCTKSCFQTNSSLFQDLDMMATSPIPDSDGNRMGGGGTISSLANLCRNLTFSTCRRQMM